MLVAALQFDVRRGDLEANLARVAAGMDEAAERGVELLVLPEMWPSSFCEPDRERVSESEAAVAGLAEHAAASRLVVVGSAFAQGPPAAAGRPFNRLQVLDRGRFVSAYDKVHLFSPTAEDQTFSAGDAPPPTVATSVGPLAGVVCYDLRFGPLVRRCFLDGAELLACPAQWPSPRAGHWEALLRGRAVENQCVVIGCNRTGTDVVGRRELQLDFPGNSAIFGPDGALLAQGRGEDGLVVAEVDLDAVRRLRRRVPVRKDQRDDLYRSWDR